MLEIIFNVIKLISNRVGLVLIGFDLDDFVLNSAKSYYIIFFKRISSLSFAIPIF